MTSVYNGIFYIMDLLRWQDVVDVSLISIVIYYFLIWTKNYRAKNLVQGILVVLFIYLFSMAFELTTISWLLKKIATVILLVFIIVFQPELRMILEKLGQSTQLMRYLVKNRSLDEFFSIQSIQNLVKVVDFFSENKIGSLLVIEQAHNLENVKETGVMLNADVSSELLLSIFYGNNPLHDGAVILRGEKIIAASCLLPLTQAKLRDRTLGTRHRAAIGLTEHTDAIVIVTSEETGIISLAKAGTLFRKLNRKRLLEHLLDYLQFNPMEEEENKTSTDRMFGNITAIFKNIFNENK